MKGFPRDQQLELFQDSGEYNKNGDLKGFGKKKRWGGVSGRRGKTEKVGLVS